MYKMMKVVGAVAFMAMSMSALAEVSVIANSAAKDLSQADVSSIYLGKDKSMKAVDLEGWNATKNGFYAAVTSKNESQLKSYWSSLIFTGKGQPLPAVASDADVIKHVSSNADGIGYVDSSSVTGDVKVLFTLP